ncbi:hypothetical protein BC940DRAFT_319954 [Gongronella butleri]|nr:hypothetical protein BC940DRAFT_319954 [Gongronella butleri]
MVHPLLPIAIIGGGALFLVAGAIVISQIHYHHERQQYDNYVRRFNQDFDRHDVEVDSDNDDDDDDKNRQDHAFATGAAHNDRAELRHRRHANKDQRLLDEEHEMDELAHRELALEQRRQEILLMEEELEKKREALERRERLMHVHDEETQLARRASELSLQMAALDQASSRYSSIASPSPQHQSQCIATRRSIDLLNNSPRTNHDVDNDTDTDSAMFRSSLLSPAPHAAQTHDTNINDTQLSTATHSIHDSSLVSSPTLDDDANDRATMSLAFPSHAQITQNDLDIHWDQDSDTDDALSHHSLNNDDIDHSHASSDDHSVSNRSMSSYSLLSEPSDD